MTTDVRISVGLPTHPKTKKLIRRTGTDGAWRLVCLFAWVAGNRPDGDLSGLTAEDIELCVDWPGVEGAFVDALLAVGFLEGTAGAYRMHDWQDHNPWAAGSDARSEKARWLAMVKHHGRDEASKAMPEYAAKLAGRANAAQQVPASSMLVAERSMPAAETSMQGPATRCAPSPSPLPLPYPLPSPPPDHTAIPEVQARPERQAAVAADRFDAAGFLVEQGADAQTAADYLQLRKQKKAASTRTALRSVVAEAAKAGIPVSVALTTCCARGWAGFKADWVAPKQRDGPAKFDPVAHVNRNRNRQSEIANIIDISAERLA